MKEPVLYSGYSAAYILNRRARIERSWNARMNGGWPGKEANEEVITLYPNLFAELGGHVPWLKTFAQYAEVSPEIMAAILEDGEEMTDAEQVHLAWRINRKRGYLFASRLQIVDPTTNKGKYRRRLLREKSQEADGLDVLSPAIPQRTLEALENNCPVPYGIYLDAMERLQEAIDYEHREAERSRRTRTTRRATA